jgi:hypothetical protein
MLNVNRPRVVSGIRTWKKLKTLNTYRCLKVMSVEFSSSSYSRGHRSGCCQLHINQVRRKTKAHSSKRINDNGRVSFVVRAVDFEKSRYHATVGVQFAIESRRRTTVNYSAAREAARGLYAASDDDIGRSTRRSDGAAKCWPSFFVWTLTAS